MSEKSLFFNAFPDSESVTGYDRNYNADDISDWFSIVCDTGVLKNGLQVVAGSGLSVNVQIGKATINGKGYINNSVMNLSLETAPTGSSPRYDLIVLRMDNTQTASARRIYLTAITGTSSVPTVSNLTRTSSVYDLLLGYVAVQPNATAIQQTNITDTRGDQTLCPWFTAVKGYDNYYDAIVQQYNFNTTLASAGTTVITNLASNLYNNTYSIVDVYCNGLKEENTDYSVSTAGGYITITFTAQKASGAEISVILSNFIDGEGLSTAINDYNNWVNDVENLKTAYEYTYICNGTNDNINISNVVNTFIQGGTDYGSMNLKIVGNFGFTAYAAGSGTSSNPYRLFNIYSGNRRVILDFTNCEQISTTTTGQCVTAFVGANLTIKGLNLIMTDAGTDSILKGFYNDVVCENCRIWINGYNNSTIATGGTFTNCRGSVLNATGNSYCFINKSILRINGGQFVAYTGNSSSKSAVIGQSSANAVSILYGVSAPTIARSGYYQTNAIYQTNSNNYVNCTDLITQLPLSVITGYSNIRGTIPFSISD